MNARDGVVAGESITDVGSPAGMVLIFKTYLHRGYPVVPVGERWMYIKMDVRTGRISCIAAQGDDPAPRHILVLLHEDLALL
jgi:hypothetical protein